MSEQLKKTDEKPASPATQPQPPAGAPAPAYVPEDLAPAWEWFQTYGGQFLVLISIGIIVGFGSMYFVQHRAERAEKASTELLANDPSALEDTIKKYGDTPPGIAANLRLAKAHYDAQNYTEALDDYDNFLKKHATHSFSDVARVGRAYSLAALGRGPEALAAFQTFKKEKPGNYLVPQATLGEAVCLAMADKKSEAKALLDDLRAANRETAWDLAAKRLQGVIDRYDGKVMPVRSLFDQANALVPLAPANGNIQMPAITPTTPTIAPAAPAPKPPAPVAKPTAKKDSAK